MKNCFYWNVGLDSLKWIVLPKNL